MGRRGKGRSGTTGTGGGGGGLELVRDRRPGTRPHDVRRRAGALDLRGAGKAVQSVALVAFERATAPEMPAKEGFATALLVGASQLRAVATSQPAARPALLNTTEPFWALSTRGVSGTKPPSWAEMYKRTPRRGGLECVGAMGRCRR